VLVARRFTDGAIDYVRNRRRIEEKTVRLISYRVDESRQDIELQESVVA
jgi:hypothetical protein